MTLEPLAPLTGPLRLVLAVEGLGLLTALTCQPLAALSQPEVELVGLRVR